MNFRLKRYLFLLFILLIFHRNVPAQAPATYSYEYFNSSHGLPSSEVICLAKDKKGYLWVGTSAGLSRYDGYEFHNYPLTKDHDLIGFVNVIVPDEQDRLWIGSDAGLFCFSNNEIIKLSASASSPQGVNDILIEKDGTVWLATENGPARININSLILPDSKKLQLSDYVLAQWPFKQELIDSRRVIQIRKAPDGTVYIAQFLNLYRFSDDKIELIHHIENQRDKILTLFPISKTKVFYNSVESEIHKVENGLHTNIEHRNLYKPGVNDGREGIWHLGTFGLYYFHPETDIASQFINVIDIGVIWSTSMLKEDNFFWVGSHNGLVKIKPSIFKVYDVAKILPRHQDYYSFLELKKGGLLLGSNRGHIVQLSDTGYTVKYKEIVPTAEIKSIYEDERGWLWLASGYQGLAIIKKDKPLVFKVENGLHDNSLSQFLSTKNGRFYVIGDQGLSEIMVSASGNISFQKHYYQPNISKHAKFFAGIEAPDGSIWVGGEEGILHLRNDSLSHFTFPDIKISVKDISKDNEGNVWIATDGEGILKCMFNNKNELELVRQFTEKDGLASLHYLSILADQEDNIWAGSSMGLTFIGQRNKYKNHIVNFDESDGFIKAGYFSFKLHQDKSGLIWAATSSGFASFKPDELFLTTVPPSMHISSVRQIKTNEEVQDLGGNNRFSYKDNSINFSFVALDYANQKGIRYFYKLEGLDSNWISAGTSRSVNYGNLPPHKYTFRVKALNNKGRASEQDAVFFFVITAPFWKTTWFILSALAFLGLVLILLFRRRIAMIKTKADIQRQLMALEIRALRSQMNPHFIFNSLNSISQLVASKRNEEGLQYLSKFSKLLRMVLNQSEKSFIPLKDEILIIDLYLQLETLRFGSSFSYTIHTDDKLDEEEILVPSFLIHPVIENAIWHGLLHKDGERRLIINFQGKDKDKLICIVKDNGIGIEAATLKKQQQLNGEKQSSKGLKMVKERLALLDEQNNGTTSFKLEDMKDDNGYISGTKCSIELPVIYE